MSAEKLRSPDFHLPRQGQYVFNDDTVPKTSQHLNLIGQQKKELIQALIGVDALGKHVQILPI